MATTRLIRILVGALVLFTSLNTYAQSATDSENSKQTAVSTTKADRQANRMLQRKVRAALTKANGVSVANVTVRARGGRVTLQGAVPDQAQSDRATLIAQRVDGVSSLTNNLTLRSPGR